MMKPSRFLTEIGEELTEKMELEEGLPHLIGGEIEPQRHENTKLLEK